MTTDEEEKKKKAEILDNWAPLDVHTWSEHPEVDKAVDIVYEEIKKDPSFKARGGR